MYNFNNLKYINVEIKINLKFLSDGYFSFDHPDKRRFYLFYI